MERLYELARQCAEKIKDTDGIIRLVSHFDADGLTSASIMIKAFIRAEKRFQLTVVKRITSEFIDSLERENPILVVFTDLGSGYLDEVSKLSCEVIIADHHELKSSVKTEKIIQFNPKLFGMNSLSGACVAYFIARAMSEKNKDLAALAIVGAISDIDHHNTKFESAEISKIIEDGRDFLQVEKGLRFFGRMTRPLHKALALSFDPYIPSVSGNESSALQFLSEAGIKIKDGEKWRTLSDLSEDEIKTLAGAIIKQKLGDADIFSNIYTLKNFAEELRDVKEFGTIINACGRTENYSTGILLCLGDKNALEKARSILINYRRLIAGYINWVYNRADRVRKTNKAIYVLGGDSISENMIGTVLSICLRSFFDKEKASFGFANGLEGVKVSARAPFNGKVNISDVLSKAASACGGVGFGHKEAAGAVIPFNTEERFIEACEKEMSI